MGVIHVGVEVKSALTATGGYLTGMSHSLNTYAGCAFGCAYCYVQELPVARYSQLAEHGWGGWVQPKLNIAEVLRAELARHAKKGTLDQLSIFMSSATDPYQPLEREHQLTRRCLEAFIDHPPGWLIIQTRGPLVTRDADLIAALGRRAMVSFTVETDDEKVRKAFSPRAPALHRRHEAMRALRAAGIYVQAAISPLLPCDPERFAEQLDALCDRALVDTFSAGDGSGGKRSARLGMPQLLDQHGWSDWRDERRAEDVVHLLRERLGPERVIWSREGFVTPPAGYGASPGAARHPLH